jgi:regulator of PEP synthase PpsR (kinase-PPPase family)
MAMTEFHLHMVSDATGETLVTVAKAAIVQFEEARAVGHMWSLVHSKREMDRVVERIGEDPGLVLYTLVSRDLTAVLEAGCRRLQVPCVAVLDPVIGALSSYLGTKMQELPGRQHVMDAEYFGRIEAVNYAMSHDDGQLSDRLEDADVVLVGVSRTSKTPTCIYLANRGVKAANVPFIPGMALPPQLEKLDGPLIVALTASPQQLVEIRRNRLLSLRQNSATDYVDLETVKAEVATARKVFSRYEWPVIDVSRRSIEETAAAILNLYARRAEL